MAVYLLYKISAVDHTSSIKILSLKHPLNKLNKRLELEMLKERNTRETSEKGEIALTEMSLVKATTHKRENMFIIRIRAAFSEDHIQKQL